MVIMKDIYVKDITKDGIEIDAPFLVKRCDLRAKHGEQFAFLTLMDKTGLIEGKFYGKDAASAARSVSVGRIYRVKAVSKKNQAGVISLYSEDEETLKFLKAGPENIDHNDEIEFIYTPADIKKNAFELQRIVAGIKNQELRIFTACCLDMRFYECPAAIRRHHEYMGGLCEHTIETVKIALNMVDTMNRTKISRDMVIAGAVLHDIGKIYCFSKVGQSYVPNDTYNLLEHITMGIMHINEYKSLISDDKFLQLEHIIQSHHGNYGDVIPITAEAWLVHQADDASALLRSIVDDLSEIPAGQKKKGSRSERFLWKAV